MDITCDRLVWGKAARHGSEVITALIGGLDWGRDFSQTPGQLMGAAIQTETHFFSVAVVFHDTVTHEISDWFQGPEKEMRAKCFENCGVYDSSPLNAPYTMDECTPAHCSCTLKKCWICFAESVVMYHWITVCGCGSIWRSESFKAHVIHCRLL